METLDKEIQALVRIAKDYLNHKQLTTESWMSPSEAAKKLPIGRQAVYNELKLAMFCHQNKSPCDLKFGIHFVETSQLELTDVRQTAAYKINYQRFRDVVLQPKEDRIPKRPLGKKFKDSLV